MGLIVMVKIKCVTQMLNLVQHPNIAQVYKAAALREAAQGPVTAGAVPRELGSCLLLLLQAGRKQGGYRGGVPVSTAHPPSPRVLTFKTVVPFTASLSLYYYCLLWKRSCNCGVVIGTHGSCFAIANVCSLSFYICILLYVFSCGFQVKDDFVF